MPSRSRYLWIALFLMTSCGDAYGEKSTTTTLDGGTDGEAQPTPAADAGCVVQTTPPKTGTRADSTGFLGPSWSDPTNALTVDANVATVSVDTETKGLRVTGFGFSIPPRARVLGVVLTATTAADGDEAIVDSHVSLWRPFGYTERKTDDSAWTTALTARTYGGPSDTWNAVVTANDVNDSDFGFSIAVKRTGSSITGARIDAFSAVIYYCE